MSEQIGIEKIGVYPGTLSLDIELLCEVRGEDFASIQKNLMTDQRSVLAPWEDTVTLAVNATHALLSEDELQTIGLLIVATESSVDQEKPISSWVHRWLGLPSFCRNFEIKHACYGATAALRMAMSWLQSQRDRTSRALIIAADSNVPAIGKSHEFITGACASAIVVSHKPDLLVLNDDQWGVYANEVTDVIRPAVNVETGSPETSLFSYFEALEGAYRDFTNRIDHEIDFDQKFAKHIYHLPFAGMGMRAHLVLTSIATEMNRSEAKENFSRKVQSSLNHSRRIGSSFGSSTAIAMLSLLDFSDDLVAGDQISIFSYGSGSCAEFYFAELGSRARELATGVALARQLDARKSITVEEYESIETSRLMSVGHENYRPEIELPAGWYTERFQGAGLLILDKVDNYYRHYRRA